MSAQGPMRRGRPPLRERKVLTPAERESLNRQIREHEEAKTPGGPGYYIPDRVDSPEEAETIRRAKRTLAQGEAGTSSRGDKMRIEAREKELRQELSGQMLSKTEMQLKPGIDPRFRKAVNECARVEMSSAFNRKATEWKNLRRRLDPDDPNVANLEHIRPDTR